MENNSLSLLSSTNRTQYSIDVTHKPEVPYMISESRLEYLEAIADQIEKYEKLEPRWNWMKNIMSGCGALFLAGIGLLLSAKLPKQPVDPQLLSWVATATIASFIGFLSCGLAVYLHNEENKEEYSSEASKIKEIIKKVRSSVTCS
jgi:hypothetical protein